MKIFRKQENKKTRKQENILNDKNNLKKLNQINIINGI